jgi:peptide/nickel transport system ATP-binding protein
MRATMQPTRDHPVDLAIPVLDIEGLTVRLPQGADRVEAISELSLTVCRDEIVCVVGESGSGKSMIAHAVMGLLPDGIVATSGDIRLEGEDLLKVSPARLRAVRGSRMSMIFQEPMTALNPVVRVGKQIAEVLRVHGARSPADRLRRTLEVMKQVGLPDPEQLKDRYPHQLSGGQRQRVMIAAALALEPALLIADEPTTALDVTTQAQILRMIRTIQQQHHTGVLFITHDFGVVAEIADRVAVMQHGRLVEIGGVEAVLRRPRHAYTRMLIASVPGLAPKVRAPSSLADTILSVAGVSKIYRPTSLFGRRGEIKALDRVSLDVRRGETFGIVGESGSGKSTLARCVIRLIDPSGGAIHLGGTEIGRSWGETLRRERKRVQIVFQDPYRSLNPRRSVGSSIVECPLNFGISTSEAWSRARELMGFVGLDPQALDRYPHEFSGGQRQRICIARALAIRPELLIADEAVSALDVTVQAQVLKLLDETRRRFDLAVLFITHDLRVAAQVCDRIAVMHQGKIVETGATTEVFSRPQHDYTRQLLASAPGRGFQFGAAGLSEVEAIL